jgi:rhodanese-related sulfurtransferase
MEPSVRDGIPAKTPAFVVTESTAACDATAAILEDAGMATDEWFEGGFTGLMRDDVGANGHRKPRLFVERVFA